MCVLLLQIKKVMNAIYQSLRQEIDLEETYAGQEVMSLILEVIKVKMTALFLFITAVCVLICVNRDVRPPTDMSGPDHDIFVP